MDELDKAEFMRHISQLRNRLSLDMPESRELSLCLTKMDEAVMWLDKAKAETSAKVSKPLR